MPQAGVSTRAERRTAAPWWEELDREAFRFPTTYEVKPARRAAGPVRVNGSSDAPKPVRAAVATVPPERETPKLAPDTSRARTSPTNGTADPRRAPSEIDGGRRTVTIRGHGAERNPAMTRPAVRRHERPGFRPDRTALWAVILGLVLILVAVASAHGAVMH
jgi:hypothetical protein